MRRLAIILAPLALIGGVLIASSAPAHANANITATSVGKASGGGTNCADASLAVGMDAVSVATESGTTTSLSGQLSTFEQSSGFSGFSGVFPDFGLSTGSPQLDRTIIGSYAFIGSATPSAADTAEWFLLYMCGATTADSVVLSSCFGDYGTCPKTAAEGVAQLFGGSVDDTTPAPGQVVTASGTGCFYPLGGAVLLDGSTGLGGGSIDSNPDGTYQIDVTVPANTAPGTALQVRLDCGYDGQTVLSTSVDLTVAATPTTEAPATTSTNGPAGTTKPRFTG
jgi:hypothetical protein